MDCNDLCKMKETLDANRDVFRGVWDDLLYYFMPEMQDSSMDRMTSSISEELTPSDPTGSKSAEILSSGIFSNTITMQTEFFGFRTNNEELNEVTEVKEWFTSASKECLRYMQNSNYQLMSSETIDYYVSTCTGVFYTDWVGDGLFYKNFPIMRCSIAEDANGLVDTIFRSFEMTAQQAYQKWGEKNSSKIIEKYNDPEGRFEKFNFFHAVLPRDPKKVKKDTLIGEEMPYASYYVDEENKTILEEGGYHEFPYAVPRFQHSPEHCFGKGASMKALSVCRQLDECREDLMDARQHALQPTTWLPVGSTEGDVDNRPNAVNFFNPQSGIPIFQAPQVDQQAGMIEQQQAQQEVKEIFYVPLFTALSSADAKMTATQVNAIKSEKAQGLSPIINRLYDEFFSPSIERTLMLLMRNGKLKPMPEALQGVEWSVEYKTRLDSMLEQIESNSNVEFFETAFNIKAMEAQAPDLSDIVDTDKMIRDMAIAKHVDMDIIRSEEETKKLREQKAIAMQQQQQAEAMQNSIAPVDLSKAPEQGSAIQQAQEQGAIL